MNAFLKLALGLCALTLITAMPNDMAKAKQGGPMRLQDLKPADMEEAVNLLRRDMDSKSALEIAKLLDDPAGVSTQDSISGSCNQNGDELECCASVSVKKIFVINFDATACISGEYVSEDLGVKFRLSVDGNTLIEKELSARNPPPICVSVPDLRGILSLCMEVSDLDISSSGTFSGCFALSAKLLGYTVISEDLGCLQIN